MRTHHSILQLQAPGHISLQCTRVLHPGWQHQPHYSASSIRENNKTRICMNCVSRQQDFSTGWRFPCINSFSFSLIPLFSSNKTYTPCAVLYPEQKESPTLIISMHLVTEVAWTQTNGSDLMFSAHSSHLRSSASLMQHQRTTLLSKELPEVEADHITSHVMSPVHQSVVC